MRVVRLHQKRFASLVDEIFIFSLKYGMPKNGHPETSRERHRDANGKADRDAQRRTQRRAQRRSVKKGFLAVFYLKKKDDS